MQVCPEWVVGEVYIGGVGLAEGYLNDSERTARVFIEHPSTGERLYKTGDLGRYIDNKNIELIGRIDTQIKKNGYRIEPGEIQHALNSHPNIKNSYIFQHDKSKELVGAVQLFNNKSFNLNYIREFLKSKLIDYMIPSRIITVDNIPLTINGKVDIKALHELIDNQQGQEIVNNTARYDNDIYNKLIKIVKEVLDKPNLGFNDNLLENGVNSIEMIKIVNQIEGDYYIRPDIEDFYKNPTIIGLHELIKEKKQNDANNSFPIKDELLKDPDKREEFKQNNSGFRQDLYDKTTIALLKTRTEKELEKVYESLSSTRNFYNELIKLEKFSNFIGILKSIYKRNNHKFLYGSAGATYPIQVYLSIKDNKIEMLEQGLYYYDPLDHNLKCISKGDIVGKNNYVHFINQPTFETSAFSLFFVAKMNSIKPLYGEKSLQFATIETGSMTQLLQLSAAESQIGICQIGDLETKHIKYNFNLDADHVLIHSLLGGNIKSNFTDENLIQKVFKPKVTFEEFEI
ncbi:SagB family peptide dehydrogenase [Virgibacillus saliphilus]|uniref:SagB family peptide dehydrogenase n=1 Tax=Virgibacillus saliphilus TaxID=2831674 RepID=UPI0035CCE703